MNTVYIVVTVYTIISTSVWVKQPLTVQGYGRSRITNQQLEGPFTKMTGEGVIEAVKQEITAYRKESPASTEGWGSSSTAWICGNVGDGKVLFGVFSHLGL